MSTPVRRHSPAVYRRRRLAVLLVLLLVVGAGVALAIWQPWRAGGQPVAGPSPSNSSAAPSPTSSPSETPTPEPTETEATPTADATIAPCSTSDLTVMAITDKEVYGSGELPQLSISLGNESEHPCLINVGTAKQEFEISSGSDTWWRSTDCQTESSDQVVQLEPGKTVTSVEPVVWDRTRSSVDTCEGERPQAPAGTFHLSVSIGGIQAADSRRFELR